MNLGELARWAKLKGISLMGTGDFTHPMWFMELKKNLKQASGGLYEHNGINFILTCEVFNNFYVNGKSKRIHNIIFAPDMETAEKLNKRFGEYGDLVSDGRPILNLSAADLVKICLDVSAGCLIVPAHAWTPHFSIFGSNSGFNNVEECFGDEAKNIFCLETGLSSDPQMNWRLSCLDRITLTSHSDAHSPHKIGREANILDTDVSYTAIANAMKKKGGFTGTIEFFPEEGKYHYDGHRMCGVSLSPEETIKNNYLCPVCGKKVTIGVMHRVDKLADRKNGFKPEKAPVFYSVIPLAEIISETVQVGVNSKAVRNEYFKLLENLGNEFKILMDCKIEEIESGGSPQLAEAISRMRKGKVSIAPGFDGEYGKVKIFEEVERKKPKGQARLF